MSDKRKQYIPEFKAEVKPGSIQVKKMSELASHYQLLPKGINTWK
jgi:transcriptional regulator CtsR